MAIKLFDIANGELILTEHCYALKSLKDVIDNYKENKQYMKIFKYFFYLYCPDEILNPCFHLHVDEKEAFLAAEIEIDFSLEDENIIAADACIKTLYETELSRAYYGIKTAVDNMASVMATERFSFGRDGSASALLQIAKNFDAVRQSYKGVYKDLLDEQKSSVRGGERLAYDS